MTRLFALLLLAAPALADSSAPSPAPASLVGRWRFAGCAYKNCRVSGTVEFRADGTLTIDHHVREDYPTEPRRGTFKYSVYREKLATTCPSTVAQPCALTEQLRVRGNKLELLRSGHLVYWAERD